MYEWISVKDELPEKSDCYLVAWIPSICYDNDIHLKEHFYAICYYSVELKSWDFNNHILAWMELPPQFEDMP